MSIKNIFWLFFAIFVLIILFITTDPTPLLNLNIFFFIISVILFLISIFFWTVAWHLFMKTKFKKLLKINIKSLAGFFAPLGLGGDILRAYFAKQERMSGTKAIGASFMVKFFKYILMFFYLLIAIIILAEKSIDFPEYEIVFISALLLTLLGAALILCLRMKLVIRFFQKIFKRFPFWRLYDNITKQFFKLSISKSILVFLILIVSTFFEVIAIQFAFYSINYQLPWLHLFMFGAIIHSLALVTITPSGMGFVEGGGFFVLSMGYYSVANPFIGSFLIVWNLVRLWIPALIGGIVAFLDKK